MPLDLDLYGDLRVTWTEARAWVQAYAPHMLRNEDAFRRYVKLWEVPRKIARAKACGDWPPKPAGHL